MSDSPLKQAPSSEETVTPPDSQHPQDLLSALIAMDCATERGSNNLLSALLNMDQENLATSSLLNAAIGYKPKLKRKIVAAAHYPQTAIKRVIQSDKRIGRMKHEVPSSIGMAMEHFAADFIRACADEAQRINCSTIKPSHMISVIQMKPQFNFLENVFGGLAAPPKKRQPTDKPILEGEVIVKKEEESD